MKLTFRMKHRMSDKIRTFEAVAKNEDDIKKVIQDILNKHIDYEEIDAPTYKKNKGKKPWLRFLFK